MNHNLSAAQRHALAALRDTGELTSDNRHGVYRITVEALARHGLCTIAYEARSEDVTNRQGITARKTRIAWHATYTPPPADTNPPQDTRAWAILGDGNADLGRVRAATHTAAIYAAVQLLRQTTSAAPWTVRILTDHETAGWLRDFHAAGRVHRLQHDPAMGYLVRLVPTGDVLVVRSSAHEAEQDTRKNAATLHAALAM